MNVKSASFTPCVLMFVLLVSPAAASGSTLGSFRGTHGTYTVNTDFLTMTGPEGFLAQGVLDQGMAVFEFDDFLLMPTAKISTIGGLRVALISNSNMQVIGDINANSGAFSGGSFGQDGAGPGGGSGAAGTGAGGGGYGGVGGHGHGPGKPGGMAYGDLEQILQAGSGGGGTTGFFGSSSGGHGGGALLLQAADQLDIFALVSVEGHTGGGGGDAYGGGGGSGGGLILSASAITVAGVVSAKGGRGGEGTFDNGGGGGGGRILIETLPGRYENYGTVTVAGGPGGSSFFGRGEPGEDGVITIRTLPIPEPTTLTLATLALLQLTRRRRR